MLMNGKSLYFMLHIIIRAMRLKIIRAHITLCVAIDASNIAPKTAIAQRSGQRRRRWKQQH